MEAIELVYVCTTVLYKYMKSHINDALNLSDKTQVRIKNISRVLSQHYLQSLWMTSCINCLYKVRTHKLVSLVIEVPVPSLYQARKVSCHVFVFCIFVVSTLPFYVIFLLDLGTVSTMWYDLYFILFLFYLFQKHKLWMDTNFDTFNRGERL